jgi:hypothetical protein
MRDLKHRHAESGFCQTMCWIGGVFVKVVLGFNGKAPPFGSMIVTLPFPGVLF